MLNKLLALAYLSPTAALTVLAGLVGSMFFARHSPAWCRFYLSGAAWFKKGVFLHIEERAIKAMVAHALPRLLVAFILVWK